MKKIITIVFLLCACQPQQKEKIQEHQTAQAKHYSEHDLEIIQQLDHAIQMHVIENQEPKKLKKTIPLVKAIEDPQLRKSRVLMLYMQTEQYQEALEWINNENKPYELQLKCWLYKELNYSQSEVKQCYLEKLNLYKLELLNETLVVMNKDELKLLQGMILVDLYFSGSKQYLNTFEKVLKTVDQDQFSQLELYYDINNVERPFIDLNHQSR